MPFITREDGERFIIPSYRDILSAKKASILKREILLLTESYGEYITLQKKNSSQYEIAFSPDPGYLLGECVWQHFRNPFDMIYCEVIPNTQEAILVIVKSGSVFLDGSFPVDSIVEELIAFRTQQNNFNIYIYGDVPLSEHPVDGKFAFDTSSVREFTILDKPVFPMLAGVKQFQLQLVETTLAGYGIGVLPTKPIAYVLGIFSLLFVLYEFFPNYSKKELPISFVQIVNPFQAYIDQLDTPNPAQVLTDVLRKTRTVETIPGWEPAGLEYTVTGSTGFTRSAVKTNGARTPILFAWAKQNGATIDIQPDGIYVGLKTNLPKRGSTDRIFKYQEVMAALLDRLSYVLPGNNLQVGALVDHRAFSELALTINLSDVSPMVLALLAKQFNDLPLVISKLSLLFSNGTISGTISFKALGN